MFISSTLLVLSLSMPWALTLYMVLFVIILLWLVAAEVATLVLQEEAVVLAVFLQLQVLAYL